MIAARDGGAGVVIGRRRLMAWSCNRAKHELSIPRQMMAASMAVEAACSEAVAVD